MVMSTYQSNVSWIFFTVQRSLDRQLTHISLWASANRADPDQSDQRLHCLLTERSIRI